MSIKEMREFLSARGVDDRDCVEKQDLVDRVNSTIAAVGLTARNQLLQSLKQDTFCRLVRGVGAKHQLGGLTVVAVKAIPQGRNPFRGRSFSLVDIHEDSLRSLPQEVAQMVRNCSVQNDDGTFSVPDSGLDDINLSFFVNNSNAQARRADFHVRNQQTSRLTPLAPHLPHPTPLCPPSQHNIMEVEGKPGGGYEDYVTTRDIEIGEELFAPGTIHDVEGGDGFVFSNANGKPRMASTPSPPSTPSPELRALLRRLHSTKCCVRRSHVHGVGVFAVTNIKKGERIFLEDDVQIIDVTDRELESLPDEVRELINSYFIRTEEGNFPVLANGLNDINLTFMINCCTTAQERNLERVQIADGGYEQYVAFRDIICGEELFDLYEYTEKTEVKTDVLDYALSAEVILKNLKTRLGFQLPTWLFEGKGAKEVRAIATGVIERIHIFKSMGSSIDKLLLLGKEKNKRWTSVELYLLLHQLDAPCARADALDCLRQRSVTFSDAERLAKVFLMVKEPANSYSFKKYVAAALGIVREAGCRLSCADLAQLLRCSSGVESESIVNQALDENWVTDISSAVFPSELHLNGFDHADSLRKLKAYLKLLPSGTLNAKQASAMLACFAFSEPRIKMTAHNDLHSRVVDVLEQGAKVLVVPELRECTVLFATQFASIGENHRYKVTDGVSELEISSDLCHQMVCAETVDIVQKPALNEQRVILRGVEGGRMHCKFINTSIVPGTVKLSMEKMILPVGCLVAIQNHEHLVRILSYARETRTYTVCSDPSKIVEIAMGSLEPAMQMSAESLMQQAERPKAPAPNPQQPASPHDASSIRGGSASVLPLDPPAGAATAAPTATLHSRKRTQEELQQEYQDQLDLQRARVIFARAEAEANE